MKNKKVYNPSDKGKRKYVSSMRNRILAGLVAAVTAASPVMATAAELGGYAVASETDGNAESLNVNTDGETAAETVTDDSGTVKITTEVGDTGNSVNIAESAESVNDVITKAEESESTGEKTETKFLFINLAKTKGGTVILNEGELDDAGKSVEKRVRLVTQTGTDELGNETTKTLINVYDKDDVLIDSEDAADNANIYVCEVKTDDVVTVKVVADDGYVVSKYDLQDRLVDGTKIDVGFDKTEGDDLTVGEDTNESSASDKTEFSYPVFMKDNMALTIELEEKQEETTDETEKSGSTDDVTDDTAKDEEAVDDADTAKDTDLTVDGEVAADDSKKDMDTDLTVGGEKTDEEAKDHEAADGDTGSTESGDVSGDVSNDTDNANTTEGDGEVTENVVGDDAGEDVNADESGSKDEESSGESEEDVNSGEAENVDTVDMTGETHFIDAAENIGDLDPASFSTARLIILSDDSNDIIDPEHIIGNYDNIYLMQYKSVEQAMNAYAYYEVNADAVEPDVAIAAADDADVTAPVDEIIEFTISEEENPISTIEEESGNEVQKSQNKTIALIDTGVNESYNIIDRVSMIDDNLSSSNAHGNKMVEAITSQDTDVSIISIRALGDDGKGTISSIVAGMEYAINKNVDIINLSIYAKNTIANSVLESEIQKAIEAGITVVGAAGNDNADAKDYMPGAVDAAWVIGAANSDGSKLDISNYGDTVDYNVVADSTSEATAKFSGFISEYGFEGIELNKGLIYETGYIPSEEPEVTVTPDEDTSGDDIEEDDDEEWTIGDYPSANDIIKCEEKIWINDKWFELSSYNPYTDDDNVKIEYLEDKSVINKKYDDFTDGDSANCFYKCSLKDTDGYYWTLDVDFEFVSERDIATVSSDKAKLKMPEKVNQDRNEGYSGIVPEFVNENVDAGTYTIIAGMENFEVENILLPYNPETFKVSDVEGINEVDVNTPGTYDVTYKMSYFMYPTYTWFVHAKINVIDIDSLEPGFYLTSKETTLALTDMSSMEYGGYGTLFKLAEDISDFKVSCVEDEYEVGVVSSDENIDVSAICKMTDNDDNTKNLAVDISNEDVDKAVVLYTERPGYTAVKSFAGGGWQIPKYSEEIINGISDSDFEEYEEAVINGAEESTDDLFTTAAGWTNVGTVKYVTATVYAGGQTGHSYANGHPVFACSNYATVHASGVANQIVNAVKSTTNINKSDVKDFTIHCYTGSAYLGLDVGAAWQCQIQVQIQQNGSNYRVQLYTDFQPPDNPAYGEYQCFDGEEIIGGATPPKVRVEIHKRFAGFNFHNCSERIDPLTTTFAFYKSEEAAKKAKSKPYKSITLSVEEDENSKYARAKIDIPYGTYWVRESMRIHGTALNQDIYKITIDASSPTKGYLIKYMDKNDLPKYSGSMLSLDSTDVENRNRIYNIPFTFQGNIFRKVSGKGINDCSPVSGAIFKIEYAGDDVSAEEFTSDASYKKWYFKSDENGYVAFDRAHYIQKYKNPDTGEEDTSTNIDKNNYGYIKAGNIGQNHKLPIGNLIITEVYAPSPYEVNPNKFYVHIEANVDANGKYTSSEAFLRYENRVKYQDENGNWAYRWDTSDWQNKGGAVTVLQAANKDPQHWAYEKDMGYMFDQIKSKKITVKKGTFASSDVMKLSAYSLKGAVFEVWTAATGGTKVPLYTDADLKNEVTNDQFITDENGNANTYYMKGDTGTYYMREITASPGHLVHDPISFELTAADAASDDVKTVEFTGDNSEMPDWDKVPNGLVQKLGYDGQAINGVVFEVRLYDGKYNTAAECPTEKLMRTWYLKSGGRNDGDGLILFDNDHLANEYKTSGEFYKDKDGNIVIPKGCTVTYQEKVAPAIYEKDETVQIWSESNSTVNMKTFYNKPKPSKIKIKKYDSDGTTPLKGVEFELKFTKQTNKIAIPGVSYLLKEGKTATAVTNEYGEAEWTNLDQGEYQITEIKTTPGHTLLTKPINIAVPITMTDAEVKAGGIDTSKGMYDGDYTNKWYFYEITYEVTNNAVIKMPTTGSNGFWKYGFFGFGIIAILGTSLVVYDSKNKKTRKRKQK